MRKTRFILVMGLALLGFSTCSKEEKDFQPALPEADIYSPAEINRQIMKSLDELGDFNWNNASDKLLFSAVMHGDSILTIGYGEGYDKAFKSTENDNIKTAIISSIISNEQGTNPYLKNGTDLAYIESDYLTVIDFKITSIETIKALRKKPGIRYLEAGGYRFSEYEQMKSSLESGCTTDPSTINSADYTNISPNCNVSWTFYKHNIPQAWQYSKGAGVTVGIVDTGVSQYLDELGSGFSNSYSPNRTIVRKGVYVDSFWPWATKTDGWHDKCGHGTRMASSLAAPLNNKYMPVGVANNCNLISYRAAKNVVLEGYHEQKGVEKAFTELANNSSVRIISMSMGHLFTVNRISDAVKYAYGKGKLIFCAGGTSLEITNWLDVIFPANMNETVAVTGIMDNGYNECNTCHKGSKIDFTVVMQRSSDYDRCSVTLGYESGEKSYAGGSSVSTAITAGIAALVAARHPDWSRDQILNKLKQSADLYPNKDSYFGYGNIDALAAVQ